MMRSTVWGLTHVARHSGPSVPAPEVGFCVPRSSRRGLRVLSRALGSALRHASPLSGNRVKADNDPEVVDLPGCGLGRGVSW